MSKLNVNEIEATSTNTDVKVVPKGADATCEIKGGTDDATLQLNCSAQSHGVKLKAPANSAGQNYTMILPDNQIAANKLLKVKSITGTGASAVGQLEFADQPSQDITSLNASALTSGTIPAARMPAIPASAGAGLQLVSKFTVSTAVSNVVISISDQDAVYKLIGRNIQLSASSNFEMHIQNSAGGQYSSGIDYTRTYHNNTSTSGAVYAITSNGNYSTLPLSVYANVGHAFTAHFAPKQGTNFMMIEGLSTSTTGVGSRHQQFITMFYNWQGMSRFKFSPATASATIQPNSEFLLYKYIES
jgi:hypothetical protein